METLDEKDVMEGAKKTFFYHFASVTSENLVVV